MAQPETDKQRRQRELDQLAFEILAARHTEWTRWTDWFELTKAKQGNCGLGNTTFSNCVKRLLGQGKVRQSQIEKNRFYQAIFTPGRLAGAASIENVPASDRAAQALAFLLSRKSPAVV
jgi:hypothetical protein